MVSHALRTLRAAALTTGAITSPRRGRTLTALIALAFTLSWVVLATPVAASEVDLPLEPGFASVNAAPILIVNPGFENTGGVVLADGAWTSNGEGLTGWTVESGGNAVGLFRPAGIFFDAIPDGEYVAFSHGRNISQVLSATLTANTEYTLEVGVGDANNTPFGGYVIQLRAGGVVLAQDSNSLVPPNGGFTTSAIIFLALPGDPQLGQNLEIVLDSQGFETSFDLVGLTAVPACGGPCATGPELALLIPLLAWARRRRSRIGI